MTTDPLVVLHDHLDGGVRPATVLALAEHAGIPVPCDDAEELAGWMTVSPDLGLEEAFSRFDLVDSVLQRPEALRRVASEAVEDLAEEGVIHAELRFAPLLHTVGGLSPMQVLEAVSAGLDDGERATGLNARLIVCAMRDQPEEVSLAVADAAVAFGGRVVGFDLAGLEPGYLAESHSRAFARAAEGGLGITVHAGEMDGPHQIASALSMGRIDRIGHGWRIIDDCEVDGGRIVGLGPIATELRESQALLEICLTSNASLGLPVAEHPVRMLADAGFRVCLNPDDRTITTTTARREFRLAEEHLGMTRVMQASMVERAAAAAFVDHQRREELAAEVRLGWDAGVSRLVHLAERDRWEVARSTGTYLPEAFSADGFIHLSGVHQVLTPANRFYRGRRDLVALVIDAHFLGEALVWEPGTGAVEYFPHLYGALDVDAVITEIPFLPSADGSFLLPEALPNAVDR